jgi:16S rRNA (cytidine1402-2'-O)-methyltransferase
MSTSKRQYLPDTPHSIPWGTLWIVATPIGNLEDFSPRGKAALEHVHTILCEDTRQGAKLISALGVQKSMSRLERLDAHTGERALQGWIARMERGESFALITDAGTPAISDPGSALVRLAREQGISVVPVPGPSAVPTLLSVAGFEETAFTFRGFFPRTAADQKRELELVGASPVSRVYVWFESPRRVVEALATIAEAAPLSQVACAKELTKIHEKVFWGLAIEVANQVEIEIQNEGELGEWVIAVRFPALETEKTSQAADKKSISEDSIKALHCLIEAGVSASEAARQVSHHFGAHKKSVYEAALKISGKKSDQGG